MLKNVMTLVAMSALAICVSVGCGEQSSNPAEQGDANTKQNQADQKPAEQDDADNSNSAESDENASAANNASANAGENNAEDASDASSAVAMEEPEFATVGMKAPGFELVDAMGNAHSLSDYAGKIVVLEWVNYGCPYVVRNYQSSDLMVSMQESYRANDVVWLTICSSSEGTQGYYAGDALINAIEERSANPGFYLLDTSGEVGKRYGAKTTPHMYVIDADGVLRYDGALDDNPTTKVKPDATNYVNQAISAVQSKMEVANSKTKPYGCSVKYKR